MLNKKQWLFVGLFSLLGLLALQVPLTHLSGSKATFTLFDAFGPIATGFIGTLPGLLAVLLMQLANFVLHGAKVLDAGTIIRFFPMLFAALYFGRNSKLNFIIPALAIVAFNLNPIGRSAWVYSMYWLIPIACYFLYQNSLLARSLGATFTAHAVGGAMWVWAFNLPKTAWLALIPVTAIERGVFALGIAATYVVMNNILNFLVQKKFVKYEGLVNQKYVFKWKPA